VSAAASTPSLTRSPGHREALASAQPPDRPVGQVLRERARAERWPDLKTAMARSYVEGFDAASPSTASTLAIARMEQAAQELGGITPSRVLEGYDRLLQPLAEGLSRRPGTLFLWLLPRARAPDPHLVDPGAASRP
jgi:hypothetical protein